MRHKSDTCSDRLFASDDTAHGFAGRAFERGKTVSGSFTSGPFAAWYASKAASNPGDILESSVRSECALWDLGLVRGKGSNLKVVDLFTKNPVTCEVI